MKRYCFIILVTSLLVLFLNHSEPRCAVYEAGYMPWSGYWWPFTSGGLVTGLGYRGSPSPLSKYDYVTTGTYYGPARNYGMAHYYDKNALSWEGMCFCWAAASILEPEPVHGGVYNRTVFHVGDKKGILTAAYHGTLYNKYSVSTPEAFHAILREFINGQKMPIIIDLGFDGEIWNYPVFKYETDFIQAGNIRHYTTTIYYPANSVSPDYVGTHVSNCTYYYYFELDGNNNIIKSGWEDSSVSNHPVNAFEPFGTEPQNPGMDYETVKRIVSTDDDPFEENDAFETAESISSGGYALMAIDRDFFKFEAENGDNLNIRFNAGEDSHIIVRSYTPERMLIQETSGRSSQVIDVLRAGEYFLEIIPDDPAKEYDYELYIQHVLPNRSIFPLNPPGLWVNGIALLSPDDTGRTIITQIDAGGYPDLSYQSRGIKHQLGILEYDFNLLSTNAGGYVRIDSDHLISGLQSITDGNLLMAGSNLLSMDTAASEIYYPYFIRTDNWETIFGLINTGDDTEEILRSSYDAEGKIVGSETIELAPGQKLENNTFYMGILKAGAKSVSASTLSGRASLLGYIKFANSIFFPKGRAVVPMSAEGKTELIVPHVASGSGWSTFLAVMNTGAETAAVDFIAYDRQGNQTGNVSRVLKANQNFVGKISDIFDLDSEIASMKIKSDNNQPICGLFLYETGDRLAGISMQPADVSRLYLPHLASSMNWSTGIGLMNAGNMKADLFFTLYDDNGETLAVETRGLGPNQRLAFTLKNFFGTETVRDGRYLKIESLEGLPICGIYLIASADGLKLMGDVIGN